MACNVLYFLRREDQVDGSFSIYTGVEEWPATQETDGGAAPCPRSAFLRPPVSGCHLGASGVLRGWWDTAPQTKQDAPPPHPYINATLKKRSAVWDKLSAAGLRDAKTHKIIIKEVFLAKITG